MIPPGCVPSAGATQFADVTGDGRADAIVVNTTGITVRRSDGSQFLPKWERWTIDPGYGCARFFADVNGWESRRHFCRRARCQRTSL